MIPKTSTNLFQIWISDHNRSPSALVKEKISSLRAMYPECDYKMYNNSDLLEFLKNNFSSDVLEAYHTVKPYAFKADLGRYCLLYMYGGYYFDAAICPEFRYQHDDYAYILQGESHTIDGKLCHALDNGIMYFREPFDPFLKSAIEKSVDNILSHCYGRNPLDITGPTMLYDLDHSRIKKFPYSTVDGKKVTCIDGQIWFEYQHGFSAVPLDDKGEWVNNAKISKADAKGTNSYSRMWHDKDVFGQQKEIGMIKKVHQIYISDKNQSPSEHIQQQMAKVKELYSGWEYTLYNNDDCRKIIHSVLGGEGVNAYDSLNSYSFRADFARYCILYKYGGQYFDASICPEFRLEFDDTAILYEPPLEWGGCRLIDNGVMIFNETEHPLLLDALQLCVKNIRDKNYGTGSLDITGPSMFGRLDKYDVTYGHCKFIRHGQKAAFLGDVLHWLYKPENTSLEKFGCVGVNNYNQLWDEKQVFNSVPTAIPKTLLQTSKDPYPEYVQEMWNQRIDETWKVEWFDDDMIIEFFKENPLPEFPNVIDVFYSFPDGGHRADLFRYYYLYLNGGFFIDSDCMSHVHMNEIHSYCHDHVFVHSDVICNRVHHPEINSPLAFNGVMGCVPKSPIVYAALQNAYNVKPRLLEKQRLYFVYMLYVISQKHKNTCNTRWLREHVAAVDSVYSTILDEDNKKVFTHFFGSDKIIPKTVELK